MTVNDCVIVGNTAEASTGYGGGIANDGSLQITGSAHLRQPGERCQRLWWGRLQRGYVRDRRQHHRRATRSRPVTAEALYSNSTATISLSTIEGNSTGVSGAGGGIFNVGQLTLADSSVGHNSTGGYGGGVANQFGLSISYSTIAENTATTQGGGIDNGDTMEAVNVTIADNVIDTAGGGGGLYAGSAATKLVNTIVAQNTVSSSMAADDIAGTVASTSTFNLIGTGGAGGLINGTAGNQVGVASPGLDSLDDNGGPTPTIALEPYSPAIDAGTNISNSGTTDQRGPGFVRILNGGIDIGAYELQPGIVTAVSVDWGTAGNAALQTAADGSAPAARGAEHRPAVAGNQRVADHPQPARNADRRRCHDLRPEGHEVRASHDYRADPGV